MVPSKDDLNGFLPVNIFFKIVKTKRACTTALPFLNLYLDKEMQSSFGSKQSGIGELLREEYM